MNSSDSVNNIIIITTKCIESIAISIYNIITHLNNELNVSIQYVLTEKECDESTLNILYIILYSFEIHNKMPKRYVSFQIEQLTSNHFNNKKLMQLKGAESIWEFSIINTLKYKDYIQYDKILFTIVPYCEMYQNIYYNFDNCEYDILFYGIVNDRRVKIINELSKKYKVFFKSNLFGKEKEEYIKKSKIILNLHYYNFASLETTRINECLQYNKLILSENTQNHNFISDALYDNLIIQFDEIKDDLSNINNLFDKLDYYLIKDNYEKYIKQINKTNLIETSEFYIKRALMNIKGLSINENFTFQLQDKIYCITNTEIQYKIIEFKKQNINKSNIEYVAIIKSENIYKSYIYTYKKLIDNAIYVGAKDISICNDTCKMSFNYDTVYNKIKLCLKDIKYDICITSLNVIPDGFKIRNIIQFDDFYFLNINYFDLYSLTIFNNSSFKHFQDLPNKLLFESDLNIYLVYPFITNEDNNTNHILTNMINTFISENKNQYIKIE